MGRSIHAGQVTVADGTPLAGEKLARVLSNDPGMGVIRHVDAGYDEAIAVAERLSVRIPMTEGLGPQLQSAGAGIGAAAAAAAVDTDDDDDVN